MRYEPYLFKLVDFQLSFPLQGQSLHSDQAVAGIPGSSNQVEKKDHDLPKVSAAGQDDISFEEVATITFDTVPKPPS